MKISTTNENPYGQIICRYFQQLFPKITKPTATDLLEIISQLLFGTKENRYGPLPAPENQVIVRNVIRTAIERNESIPILVPWGSRKPVATDSIDISEVSALYQLISLDNAIKAIFPPGLKINIRVEDTGALWMYRDENSAKEIEKYADNFTKLVEILRGDNLIESIPESIFMTNSEYFAASEEYSFLIERYLKYSEDTEYALGEGPDFQSLTELGWKGIIPWEQRDYYYNSYEKLYWGINKPQKRKKLADYLGGAIARYKLGARAEPKTDYGFIQLTFVQPIPGAPQSIFGNTLYWRSVSANQCRTNISPWRAKGYFNINGNEVKTKITSWSNQEIIEQLHEGSVIFTSERGDTVEVKADYIVEE